MGLSVLFMFILRNVFIAEVVDGRPVTRKTVAVRFSEFEASVNSISVKVVEALGDDEPIVLVDSHANEILDCEGNRGTVNHCIHLLDCLNPWPLLVL